VTHTQSKEPATAPSVPDTVGGGSGPRGRGLPARVLAHAPSATRALAGSSVRNLRHTHPDADVQALHLAWNEPREPSSATAWTRR
jgi:hypothetical protein